jgi:Na+-transporting methylmalonyl-CoA/oxaloacetate decarboxylase gamma subunit
MLAEEGVFTDQQILYILGIVALIVLLVLIKIVRAVLRAMRRRRPAKIHPKLQKYAEEDASRLAERGRQAAKIITTSSRAEIAGYRVMRQVEAVFVDGYRDPGDAIEGLKATAALKGANAVINLQHQRTAAGRCTASGDAVVVEPERNDGTNP